MTIIVNNLKQAATRGNQKQYLAGLLSLNAVKTIEANPDYLADTPIEFWSTVGNIIVDNNNYEKSMPVVVRIIATAFIKQVGRKMTYAEKDLCGMLAYSVWDLYDTTTGCCKVFYDAEDFCALTSNWEQYVSAEDYKKAFNDGWKTYLKVKGQNGWYPRLERLTPDYFTGIDMLNNNKAAEAATLLTDAFLVGGLSHGQFDNMSL